MILELRRREQDLRAAVPVGAARGRAVSAGHRYAERLCAPAAPGSRRFFTPTGFRHQGSPTGKETRRDRRRALRARGTRSAATSRSSRRGRATGGATLVFRKTARNFNPAGPRPRAKVTIVEVEPRLVDGRAELEPDAVHLPSIYVNRIFQGTRVREADRAAHDHQSERPASHATSRSRSEWPRRVAAELRRRLLT